MTELDVREELVEVVDGELAHRASWVYVWVRGDEVLHTGATWLPPAVRTWLHLHHENPEIGRVRATSPGALEGDVKVWAFEVPEGLDRQAVRRVVMEMLDGSEIPDEEERVVALARTIVTRMKKRLSK